MSACTFTEGCRHQMRNLMPKLVLGKNIYAECYVVTHNNGVASAQGTGSKYPGRLQWQSNHHHDCWSAANAQLSSMVLCSRSLDYDLVRPVVAMVSSWTKACFRY